MKIQPVKIEDRQHLIIDADDTLWENNIYFERAFEEFCDFLAHSSMTPQQVRAVLDEIETVNNKIHGYGSANFARNLTECYRKLSEREPRVEDLPRIMSFADADSASAHRNYLRGGGDAGVSLVAARPDPVHQGQSGRAKAEAGPLGVGNLFRAHGHRARRKMPSHTRR